MSHCNIDTQLLNLVHNDPENANENESCKSRGEEKTILTFGDLGEVIFLLTKAIFLKWKQLPVLQLYQTAEFILDLQLLKARPV